MKIHQCLNSALKITLFIFLFTQLSFNSYCQSQKRLSQIVTKSKKDEKRIEALTKLETSQSINLITSLINSDTNDEIRSIAINKILDSDDSEVLIVGFNNVISESDKLLLLKHINDSNHLFNIMNTSHSKTIVEAAFNKLYEKNDQNIYARIVNEIRIVKIREEYKGQHRIVATKKDEYKEQYRILATKKLDSNIWNDLLIKLVRYDKNSDVAIAALENLDPIQNLDLYSEVSQNKFDHYELRLAAFKRLPKEMKEEYLLDFFPVYSSDRLNAYENDMLFKNKLLNEVLDKDLLEIVVDFDYNSDFHQIAELKLILMDESIIDYYDSLRLESDMDYNTQIYGNNAFSGSITFHDYYVKIFNGDQIIVDEAFMGLRPKETEEFGISRHKNYNGNIDLLKLCQDLLSSLDEKDLINIYRASENEHIRKGALKSIPEVLFPKSNGKFVDERDNRIYSWIKIGFQIWMSENLAYLPIIENSTSTAFRSETVPFYRVRGYNGTKTQEAKETAFFKSYGVFYNFPAAQSACPPGWHLPTEKEWDILTDFVSGIKNVERVQDIGNYLKSSSWGGSNQFGFSALPTGHESSRSEEAYWWISSSLERWDKPVAKISGDSFYITSTSFEGNGYCVRCVKD